MSGRPFAHCEPIFKTLAPENGYGYMGTHGAGHFVKMVHNGVEYGMLQAYGEGFEIIEKSQFSPDLREVTRVWQNGSVVRSWLLDLAALAFADDPTLENISGYVEDSGEGRWTVQAAIDENVPAPVITLSLLQRFVSRQPESFSAKVIAALRNQFGGHAVKFESGEMGGCEAPGVDRDDRFSRGGCAAGDGMRMRLDGIWRPVDPESHCAWGCAMREPLRRASW